jgi:hypothetical protein
VCRERRSHKLQRAKAKTLAKILHTLTLSLLRQQLKIKPPYKSNRGALFYKYFCKDLKLSHKNAMVCIAFAKQNTASPARYNEFSTAGNLCMKK